MARHVAALGLAVVEVDAAEFIKGGGGARALMMSVY
jgi:N-dimethylarginine dimethylaminohydrolase